jgi:hypothetical protein
MTIRRWYRKPDPRRPGPDVITARYDPRLAGADYRAMHADLLAVARMADGGAQTAEALFEPGGTVLLVRYLHSRDDHPAEVDWVVVRPGNYLCYSPAYGSLGEDTDPSLTHWYDPAAGDAP